MFSKAGINHCVTWSVSSDIKLIHASLGVKYLATILIATLSKRIKLIFAAHQELFLFQKYILSFGFRSPHPTGICCRAFMGTKVHTMQNRHNPLPILWPKQFLVLRIFTDVPLRLTCYLLGSASLFKPL